MSDYLETLRLAEEFGLAMPGGVREVLEAAREAKTPVRFDPNPTCFVNIDTFYVKKVEDCDGSCARQPCAGMFDLADGPGWFGCSSPGVHVPASTTLTLV